jgi:hypothetical protein
MKVKTASVPPKKPTIIGESIMNCKTSYLNGIFDEWANAERVGDLHAVFEL